MLVLCLDCLVGKIHATPTKPLGVAYKITDDHCCYFVIEVPLPAPSPLGICCALRWSHTKNPKTFWTIIWKISSTFQFFSSSNTLYLFIFLVMSFHLIVTTGSSIAAVGKSDTLSITTTSVTKKLTREVNLWHLMSDQLWIRFKQC